MNALAACTLREQLSNDVIVGLNWQRATKLTSRPAIHTTC